jgi:hypothetical protein
VTLALGTRLASSGSGGNVRPPDDPIMRRDLLQEDNFFIYCEDGSASKIVITFGTFDSVVVEDGTTFLVQEDNGKLIIQPN